MPLRDTLPVAPVLVLAGLLLQGCSLSGNTAPRPAAVDPPRGLAAQPTRIVILGEDFLVRPLQQASGSSPTVDSAYRAWMGSTELEEVAWVDVRTLHATVPAGLPAGPHPLVVEGPFGRQGRLESAFTVLDVPPGSLTVEVAASPALVSAGQSVAITATVANGGSGDVRSILPGEPSVSAPAGVEVPRTSGPDPASVTSLAPGARVAFSWTFVPSAAGTVTFGSTAAGTDVLSGSTVEAVALAAAQVVVQRPAALDASLSAPLTVAPGVPFEVSMEVRNTGDATAMGVVPGPLALAPGSVGATLESGPTPASANIPGGESRTFVWAFRTGTALGTLRLSGSAAGADGNGGWGVASPVAATTDVTVASALLLGTLSADPATVSIGGTLRIVLQVRNPGSASAVGIVTGEPVLDGSGLLEPAGVGPVPATIASLAPGASATFTWTYTARRAGAVGFAVTVRGTDAVSGTALAASASMVNGVTISGAALVATRFVASQSTGAVGVPVTLTLDLVNSGVEAATIGGIVPSASPAATASCGVPTPATPVPVTPGGTATFTWTCSATQPGTYVLGAAVAATGTATGAPLGLEVPPVTIPVTTPQALSVASFTLARTTANVGQAIGATLRLSNPTTRAATVTALSPASTPTAGVICTAAAPAPPQALAGGAGLTFTWSCTATAPGSYLFGGGALARDSVSGVDMSPSLPGSPVLVQLPAALAVTTFAATPPTIALGASTTVTLVLQNGGGASVNVAGVAPTIDPPNRGTCTAATPAPPRVIPGGGSLTFTWTCTGTQRRSYTLDGTITATDANGGGSVAPNLPTRTLVIQ